MQALLYVMAKLSGVLEGRKLSLFRLKPGEGAEKGSSAGMTPMCKASRAWFVQGTASDWMTGLQLDGVGWGLRLKRWVGSHATEVQVQSFATCRVQLIRTRSGIKKVTFYSKTCLGEEVQARVFKSTALLLEQKASAFKEGLACWHEWHPEEKMSRCVSTAVAYLPLGSLAGDCWPLHGQI